MASDYDPYEVSWARKEPTYGYHDNRHERFYSAFRLEGTTYEVGDTVYLQAPDGPPYIARIIRLREDSQTKLKKMLVRWFCRPCELPLDHADVSRDNKEIFISWKSGSQIEVDPASTLRKCKALCTWNRPAPFQHEIDDCEHFFCRVFDTSNLKMRSLHDMVDKVDLANVFGRRDPPDVKPTAASAGGDQCVDAAVRQGSKQRTAPLGGGEDERVVVGNGTSEHITDAASSDPRPPPTPGREASQCPPSGTGCRNGISASPGRSLDERLQALLRRQTIRPGTKTHANRVFAYPKPGRSSPGDANLVAMKCSDDEVEQARVQTGNEHGAQAVTANSEVGPSDFAEARPAQQNCAKANPEYEHGAQGVTANPEVGPSDFAEARPSQQNCAKANPEDEHGAERVTASWGVGSPKCDEAGPSQPSYGKVYPKSAAEVAKAREWEKPPPAEGCADEPVAKRSRTAGPDHQQNQPSRPVSNNPAPQTSENVENYVRPTTHFITPWKKILENGLKNLTALLLQGLDPMWSSCDIEEMLQQLMKARCDVRMIPPKYCASYISGEAIVVFEKRETAQEFYSKFKDSLLILDERPVSMRFLTKKKDKVNRFIGYFNPATISLPPEYAHYKAGDEQGAHFAQPNSIEFDCGLVLRAMQDRHTEAWRASHQAYVNDLKGPVLQEPNVSQPAAPTSPASVSNIVGAETSALGVTSAPKSV